VICIQHVRDLTSDSRTFCGAGISNSLISNNNSFLPEGFETAPFQNGCLAFSSPALADLCLKLKSSVTSTSVLLKLSDVAGRQLFFPMCQGPVPYLCHIIIVFA
jgi:hypothetical protein